MVEITVDRNFEIIKDVKEIDGTFEDPYIVLGKILASSFIDSISDEERSSLNGKQDKNYNRSC